MINEIIESKLNESVERFRCQDKMSMPRVYITKETADAVGYFAPGEEVYVVQPRHYWADCSACDGCGWVSTTNIASLALAISKCEECAGMGLTLGADWVVEKETIKHARVILSFLEDGSHAWEEDVVFVESKMLAINTSQVYKTYEEALMGLAKKQETMC